MSGAIIDGLLRRIADTEKERDEAYAERDLHIRAAGLLEQEIEKTREAALREAHKAILAMDTKKDEDLTYNLAVLRAAEKVRRLIDEART